MPNIAFVTDSTGYIPPEYCTELNITILPQVLIWGDQTYRDGVDIQADEFYARLRTADHLTVQVNRRGQNMNLDFNIK